MKIFHINNPASGNKSGAKHFSLINKEFQKRSVDCKSVQTEYAGHATEIIRNLDFSRYDGIAISGGDGSLFEAINGYFANQSNLKIPVGVIPVGRGNAFARDLNLHPDKWEKSVDVIVSNKSKMVDVGFCKNGTGDFYFINILGFGFVTDVARTAFKVRALGHLSYILGVLYRTISLKSYKLKIEVDGKIYERDNVFAEISNTRYTGKDFLMAPSAEINDGMLDITLLNKITRVRLLQCLPKIFTGNHLSMREVESIRGSKIKVETVPNKLLTPDGQLTGSTPLEIECLKEHLPVFIE